MNDSIEDIVSAWTTFLEDNARETLISDTTPRETGCGLVYELGNPLKRPNESFAIADARRLERFEPHYHVNETEIYIVLSGQGTIVVGGTAQEVTAGDAVVIPPDTAHFAARYNNLVLAVINTPPFNHENTRGLTKSNPDVGYDKKLYEELTRPA